MTVNQTPYPTDNVIAERVHWSSAELFLLQAINAENSKDDLEHIHLTDDNWREVLQLCDFHRVHNIVFDKLNDQSKDAMPVDVMEQFHSRIRKNKIHALNTMGLVAQLADAFEQTKIRFLLLKGEAISYRFYPSPDSRFCNDIDIIIEEGNLFVADEILKDLGFEQTIPDFEIKQAYKDAFVTLSKDVVYRNQATGIIVELHWRLLRNPCLFPVNLKRELQRCERINIAGRNIPVFNRPTQLVYMLAHGAVSNWMRLKWQADISLMLNRMSDEELSQANQLARSFGLERVFDSGILVCDELFNTEYAAKNRNLDVRAISVEFAKHFVQTIKRGELQNRHSFKQFGSAIRSNWRIFRLLPSIKYKLWHMVLALTPADTVGTLKLSRKWIFIYIVFGFFRRAFSAIGLQPKDKPAKKSQPKISN